MTVTTLDPQQIIDQAAQQGSLSQGQIGDLLSPQGIALASTDDPVILLLPPTPVRNVKYNLRTPPPRFIRGFQNGRPVAFFEGAEHNSIGDNIFLYFPNQPPQLAGTVPLSLPNGLQLTYGQIVALGGDFYGVPDEPISDGTTPQDRVQRFTNAFNSLATAQGAVTEMPQIWAVMTTEVNAVNQALLNGQSPAAVYRQLGDSLSGQWNVITGGGSFVTNLYPLGRYLELAAKNWDHFGNHAVLAYQAGHAAALQQAITAGNASGQQQIAALQLAYAMNAFADHFLSDLFSAGHTRTPRKELYNTVTPQDLGSLLSRYMHDEDNLWGLSVTDAIGQGWRAYGDKRYFDTVDVTNKNLVDFAVQDSSDEVYLAFSTGQVPAPANYVALQRIANLQIVSDSSQAQALGNNSPMFVVSGATVLRRNDVNNLNDYSWTGSWWGWSTELLLKSTYSPNPPTGYPSLPNTAPALSTTGWQSSQAVPPNWINGNQVRYAVSFLTLLYESNPGPWGTWVTIQNQAFPTLTGIPTGSAGTVGRRIYRQFQGSTYSYVGQISDNTTTTFIDNNP
jgi:hypothetical protein